MGRSTPIELQEQISIGGSDGNKTSKVCGDGSDKIRKRENVIEAHT